MEDIRIKDNFYYYYETFDNYFVYTLINSILDTNIIKSLDKYNTYIIDNGLLLLAGLVKIKGPETEAAPCIIDTKFQYMNFVEYY